MKLLLDTCVLAELQHPNGNSRVKSAVAALPENSLYLSVVTVGEIAKGIMLLPEGQKKNLLSTWLDGLREQFSARIIPIDAEIAQLWGTLTAHAQFRGIILPTADGLIAATALKNGLQLMTRNQKDFESTGVHILNPWLVH